MPRKYPFDLPYHVSGFLSSFVTSKLVEAGIWNELPEEFHERISNSGWGGFDINEEDLNSLSDETYKKLETLFE